MDKKNQLRLLQDDDSLTTPAHDEMVCYLLQKENILKILPGLNKYLKNPGVKILFKGNHLYQELWKRENIDFLDALNNSEIFPDIAKYDELVVTGHYYNQFRDLSSEEWQFIISEFKDIQSVNIPDCNCRLSIQSEVPINGGYDNRYILGYWDIHIKIVKPDEYEVLSENNNFVIHWAKGDYSDVYIEVKPKITSFGQTLRQLNTYAEYTGKKNIYLFTRDSRFKEQFESQGIHVIIQQSEGS